MTIFCKFFPPGLISMTSKLLFLFILFFNLPFRSCPQMSYVLVIILFWCLDLSSWVIQFWRTDIFHSPLSGNPVIVQKVSESLSHYWDSISNIHNFKRRGLFCIWLWPVAGLVQVRWHGNSRGKLTGSWQPSSRQRREEPGEAGTVYQVTPSDPSFPFRSCLLTVHWLHCFLTQPPFKGPAQEHVRLGGHSDVNHSRRRLGRAGHWSSGHFLSFGALPHPQLC